ncbi:MAG: response regulator [Planctomycetaceae bacterium]|nr:response regulator [Planctomycetaceae bacterium]
MLVIDDDPQIRSLVMGLLRRDYFVSVASDGEAGYQKAMEHTPDVAIIDIQMPVWDGLRTLQAFRSHLALRSVRIIMLTADSSRQTVMAAISSGADDYVVKTALSKDDLLQKLSRVRSMPPAVRSAAEHSGPNTEFLHAETPCLTIDGGASPPAPEGAGIPASGAVFPESASSEAEVDPRRLQEMLDAWE